MTHTQIRSDRISKSKLIIQENYQQEAILTEWPKIFLSNLTMRTFTHYGKTLVVKSSMLIFYFLVLSYY